MTVIHLPTLPLSGGGAVGGRGKGGGGGLFGLVYRARGRADAEEKGEGCYCTW